MRYGPLWNLKNLKFWRPQVKSVWWHTWLVTNSIFTLCSYKSPVFRGIEMSRALKALFSHSIWAYQDPFGLVVINDVNRNLSQGFWKNHSFQIKNRIICLGSFILYPFHLRWITAAKAAIYYNEEKSKRIKDLDLHILKVFNQYQQLSSPELTVLQEKNTPLEQTIVNCFLYYLLPNAISVGYSF